MNELKDDLSIEKRSIEITFSRLEPISKVLENIEEMLSKGIYENKVLRIKVSLYY